MNLWSIPEFREEVRRAVDQETLIRDVAFLDLPESICGIEVLPMTPRHHLLLEIARSPFVCGGTPTPLDVCIFLWAVSPGYHSRSRWRRYWFYRRLGRRRDVGALVKGIEAYIAEAFHDRPPSIVGRGDVQVNSFAADIIDVFAHRYGWAAVDILNTPYKQLFQLLKPIRRSLGIPTGGGVMHRIRASWRAKLNEQNKHGN